MRNGICQTRRHFLASTALMSPLLRAAPMTTAPPDEPQVLLPEGFGLRLAVREDGHLLGVVNGTSGSTSRDGGETWDKPFAFLQGGGTLAGSAHHIVPLEKGRLGMIYFRSGDGHEPGYRTLTFAASSDGGRNWSRGADLAPLGPYSHGGVFTQVPFGRLCQLSSGRLLLPVYWQYNGLHEETRTASAYGRVHGHSFRLEGHNHRPEMSGCYVRYSDDEGATWKRSEGSVMVWPLPGEGGRGGFGGTTESVLVELRDGHVLMLLRTKVGRFFQSLSDDRGRTWHLATATTLSSGDVPCDLDRLRNSGHLVVIWNQTSGEEIRRGFYRSRLSAAISRDDGRTWERHRTLISSPGLDAVGRIGPPPVAHIRVKPDAGDLPQGFCMFHYPSLAFSWGRVFITYKFDRFEGKTKTRRIGLIRVPESWLLGGRV